MRLGRVFLLSIGMFALGVFAHKGHYIPKQVRALESRLEAWSVRPELVLAGQYSQNRERLPPVYDIDTALLPLRVRRTRLSDVLPVPKVGGAITTIGNTVIVLDRLGNLYSSLPSARQFAHRPFPPLPNAVSDYVRTPGAHLDANRFRAYDIKYVKSANLFAVSHEFFDKHAGKSRLAVSVIGVDEQTIKPTGDWKTVFLSDPEENGPNVEAGGRLASKDGRLYLTIGDYETARTFNDARSSLGKIVAIDLDTHKHQIISRGHRNPQGLLITNAGDMFSTEHGPAGGDELNLITQGADYGWPHVTLGTDYGKYSWQNAQVGRHAGYQAPAFAWVPSVGLSNLIQVSGFSPRWDGDLLVGSLKATSIFRVRLDKTRTLYVEPIWIGQRIRDIAQIEDGTIVLWTDDTQLLFVSVDRSQLAQDVRATKVASSTVSDTCLYCHHFGPTKVSDFAPTLSDLFDRRIASDNFRYSAGLRSKEGVWTEEALREFLNNPAEFANGTSMPRPNLDEDQFEAVIEELKRSGHPEVDSPRESSPGIRVELAKHHGS
jgi:cytochrome c2